MAANDPSQQDANANFVAQTQEPYKAGHHLSDGTVYGSRNKKGQDLFVAPQDLPGGPKTLREAQEAIAELNRNNYLGHNDWDLPTGWDDPDHNDELAVLCEHRKAIGGFKKNGLEACYGSSSLFCDGVCARYFDDGVQDLRYEVKPWSWRFLRRVNP